MTEKGPRCQVITNPCWAGSHAGLTTCYSSSPIGWMLCSYFHDFCLLLESFVNFPSLDVYYVNGVIGIKEPPPFDPGCRSIYVSVVVIPCICRDYTVLEKIFFPHLCKQQIWPVLWPEKECLRWSNFGRSKFFTKGELKYENWEWEHRLQSPLPLGCFRKSDCLRGTKSSAESNVVASSFCRPSLSNFSWVLTCLTHVCWANCVTSCDFSIF